MVKPSAHPYIATTLLPLAGVSCFGPPDVVTSVNVPKIIPSGIFASGGGVLLKDRTRVDMSLW